MIEIRNEKFTENVLSIRYLCPLERKTITAWNILVLMLCGRSRKYSTREAMAQAVSHAYGLQGGYGLFGYGLQLMIEFRMRWIREDLIDQVEYNHEVQTLLHTFQHEPLLEEKYLEEAKYLLKKRLEAQEQDPDGKALQLACQKAGEGTHFALNLSGYLEEVDEITLETIQDLFQTLQKAPHITLFSGVLSDSLRPLFQEEENSSLNVKWNLLKPSLLPKEVIVEKEISQSSLVQVYATGVAPNSPLYPALVVLSGLLGNSSVSLLFEIIREQYSYCYAISSSIIRFDGALLITTAAHRKNFPKIQELITTILDDIQNQRIDPSLLETIKKELCNNIRLQKDSLVGPINQQFVQTILNQEESAQDFIKKLEAVSVEDVSKMAKGLQLVASAQLLQKEETPLDFELI